jgi:dolichol kinase
VSELKRRLVHVSGTGLPLLYVLGAVTWRQLGLLLVALSAVAAGLEAIRLLVGLEWAVFDELTREYEQENVAGYALYLFSQTGVALVFPPAAAVPAMLMLTVGDPISGLLGSTDAGEVKAATTLSAMFAVCLAIAWPFVRLAAADPVRAAVAAAVGAAGATVADGVKPVVAGYVIDNNASIPPAAAAAIYAVLRLL